MLSEFSTDWQEKWELLTSIELYYLYSSLLVERHLDREKVLVTFG